MTDWRKVEDRILCGMMIVVMGVLTALSQKIEGLTSHATKIAKALGSNT